MAKSELLFKKIEKWEGGWSDHKNDKGGKTNMGITLKTWKSMGYDKTDDGIIDEEDLKLIDRSDVFNLFKKHFWDKCKGDNIISQSLANMIVDWYWNSGTIAIKRLQRLLSLKDDGVFGSKTLASVNGVMPREFLRFLQTDRKKFIEELCEKDPSQKVFLNGWMNRINDFKFED